MTSPYLTSTSPSPELSRSNHGSNAGTSGSTSALRPRNRRLIATELTSTASSVRGTSQHRDVSPIPSRHPSRIAGSQRAGGNAWPVAVGGLLGPGQDGGSRGGWTSPTIGFGKGLWDGGWTGSWTALQGLASSVLGGDVADGIDEGNGTDTRGRAWVAGKKRPEGTSSAMKAPATWGPSGLPQRKGDGVGAGSLVERDLAVKARKTASVLESHERANGGLDVNGNYKRRTSLESPNSPGQQNPADDALVYVHHVRPSDTLAGVVLKYNCEPAVFRKANRLWPNDMIQIRKVVLLPVDACGIKGRPCDPPMENKPIDLLAPTPIIEDSPSSSKPHANGATWGHQSQNGSTGDSPWDDIYNSEKLKPEDEAQPWVHVRWVLLDSSPSSKPVEIARLPRKTLGYFPPRRRKSQATISSASTPRGSLDINHLQQDHRVLAPGTPPRQSSNLRSHSNSGSYFPAPTSNPISRRDSISDLARPPAWLRGPGGVGTLSKDVRSPGPAEDSLNSWASKHIPMLGLGHLPSSSILGANTATFGFNDDLSSITEGRPAFLGTKGSGTATPSGSGTQGMGLGFENAAAALEGWVRRLATKAPGTPKLGMGTKNAGPDLGGGEGDLIELLDGAGSDDGRSFEPLAAAGSLLSLPVAESSGRIDRGTARGRLEKGKGKSD